MGSAPGELSCRDFVIVRIVLKVVWESVHTVPVQREGSTVVEHLLVEALMVRLAHWKGQWLADWKGHQHPLEYNLQNTLNNKKFMVHDGIVVCPKYTSLVLPS